jgi:hypothetical protein
VYGGGGLPGMGIAASATFARPIYASHSATGIFVKFKPILVNILSK